MAVRLWTPLVCALLATALLAGCTNKDTPDDGGTDGTGTDGGGGNGPGANATRPDDFNLTDADTIEGPFSQSWDIAVENVGFTSATVHFALSGVQAGAPPTARINLALLDPDGGVVKSAVLGLGGAGNSVDWSLTPEELSTPGTYKLQATSGDEAPLPSAGLANYDLAVLITY